MCLQVQLAPEARKVPGAPGPVFADAPVSGGVPGAVGASLTFMCGGSSVALRAAQPLLQLMGKRIEHLGVSQLESAPCPVRSSEEFLAE